MDEITIVKIILSTLMFVIPVATYLIAEAILKRIYKKEKGERLD